MIHAHLLALLYSPPTTEGNIWLYSCPKLHYVHRLFANFVARQDAMKYLPSASVNNAHDSRVKVNQNCKLHSVELKRYAERH